MCRGSTTWSHHSLLSFCLNLLKMVSTDELNAAEHTRQAEPLVCLGMQMYLLLTGHISLGVPGKSRGFGSYRHSIKIFI